MGNVCSHCGNPKSRSPVRFPQDLPSVTVPCSELQQDRISLYLLMYFLHISEPWFFSVLCLIQIKCKQYFSEGLMLHEKYLIKQNFQHPASTKTYHTPPLKKVQEPKNFIWLLTLFLGVIYQADQDLGCPRNGGWGNFAQLQKFQVK